MDIDGEYAAIGAAIEEMIPGRYRRQVDIAINETCWGGALLGTLAGLVTLNRLPDTVSWRIGFLLGPALAIAVLYVQRNPPANHRWLVIHGKLKEAEAAIRRMKIEAGEHGKLPLLTEPKAIPLDPITDHGYFAHAHMPFRPMPRRRILNASLIASQTFISNAIILICALALGSVYHAKSGPIPLYFLAFAIGHLVGLLVLARLFDTTGCRVMISSTSLLSGLLLALTAWAFAANLLSAFSQTICLSVIIFCALAGAGLMVLDAIAELAFGVAAKRQSPEELATPLSSAVTSGTRLAGGTRIGFAHSPCQRTGGETREQTAHDDLFRHAIRRACSLRWI